MLFPSVCLVVRRQTYCVYWSSALRCRVGMPYGRMRQGAGITSIIRTYISHPAYINLGLRNRRAGYTSPAPKPDSGQVQVLQSSSASWVSPGIHSSEFSEQASGYTSPRSSDLNRGRYEYCNRHQRHGFHLAYTHQDFQNRRSGCKSPLP